MALVDVDQNHPESSRIDFGGSLDFEGVSRLMDYIGSTPGYSVEWERSQRAETRNGVSSRVEQIVGKIYISDPNFAPNFTLIGIPEEGFNRAYTGIQFNAPKSDHFREMRVAGWSKVREIVQKYLNYRD